MYLLVAVEQRFHICYCLLCMFPCEKQKKHVNSLLKGGDGVFFNQGRTKHYESGGTWIKGHLGRIY